MNKLRQNGGDPTSLMNAYPKDGNVAKFFGFIVLAGSFNPSIRKEIEDILIKNNLMPPSAGQIPPAPVIRSYDRSELNMESSTPASNITTVPVGKNFYGSIQELISNNY